MEDISMKYNLALRGGAAKTLAYAKVLKELDNKPDVTFGTISGASGGALFGAIIGCGYTSAQAEQMLLELRGDEYMKASEIAELSKNPFKKIFYGAKFFGKKNLLFREFRDTIQKYLTWEKMTRTDNFYACIVPLNKLALVTGSDKLFTFKDMYTVLRTKGNFDDLSKLVQPWYCSNTGIYVYYPNRGMVKLSNTVVPLWLCVMSSFWNPVFPKLDIVYETGDFTRDEKIHPFDGGILNNEANLPLVGQDYIQVACVNQPGKVPQSISEWYYNLGRSPNFVHVPYENPKPGFFSFYDSNLKLEFAPTVPSTNIFV